MNKNPQCESIERGCYIVLISLISGCGLFKKEKSSEASALDQNPQPLPQEVSLLAPDDLKVTEGYSVNETSGLDFVEELKNERLLRFLSTDDATLSTKDSTAGSWRDENWDCFSIAEATFQANKISRRVMTTVDGSDCVKQQYKELGVEVVNVKAIRKFYYYQICTLEDLSLYHGKKISEIQQAPMLDICTNGSLIYQDVIDLDATTIREGVTSVQKRRTIKQIASADFAQSNFVVSGSTYSLGDGTTYFRKVEKSLKGYSPDTETTETKNADITQYKFHDVRGEVSASSNIWFDTGKVDIVHNNWTGTLVYKGSNVSPTYTLKANGTNENLTGSLTTEPTK